MPRVKSDRVRDYEEMMEPYKEFPVDLYGKRVGGSLQEQAKEIHEYYGLDIKGPRGGE